MMENYIKLAHLKMDSVEKRIQNYSISKNATFSHRKLIDGWTTHVPLVIAIKLKKLTLRTTQIRHLLVIVN